MKLRFLGTGSGMPDPGRMSSAILVEGSGGGLLIDAGEGVARRLREPEHWSQDIRTILVTHSHTDHFCGLPMLLQGWYLDGRRKPLELVMPEPLRVLLEHLLEVACLDRERLPFDLQFHDIDEGEFELRSGHVIEAWLNGHLPLSAGGSYSVAFTTGSRRWIISSDLIDIDSLEGHLSGSDGIIVETTHVLPEQAVALARSEGVPRVLLTHIPPGNILSPVGNAVWAADNMLIEL